MKDPIAVKALICVGLTCTALAPRALYWTSDKYIRLYNTTSNYITDTTEKTLNKLGLQTIQPEVLKIDDEDTRSLIEKEALAKNINPKLAFALARHESVENPDALSLKGAIGIMQVMPNNYQRCGLKYKSDLWIKAKNIKCGLQIFSEELITYKNNIMMALNSYNGGPNCVNKTGGESPCAESRKHAFETLKLYAQNSALL